MNKSISLNETFNLSGSIPATVDKIRITCIGLWAIIICFGIFGNFLTIAVLISPKLNNSSTTFYLTVLALIDILYLLFSLGGQMFDFVFFFPWTMGQQHPFACISLNMIRYTLAYISVWLLVAVAIDRMIWVIYPFGAKRICTRNIAKIIVSIFFLIFVIIDIHFIWTLEFIRHAPGLNSCNLKTTSLFQYIFPYIDLTLIMGLPFIIMCTANILIIVKLREMEKLRKRMKSSIQIQSDSSSNEKKNKNIKYKQKQSKENVEDNTIHFEKSKRSTRRRSRYKQTTSLTKMLLSVNIFFLVSTTPLLSYNVVYFVTNIKTFIEQNEKDLGGIIFCLERVLYTLWYLNFAVHFLLYCMSGPKFRQEAMRLLMKYFCLFQRNESEKRYKHHTVPTTINVNDNVFVKPYAYTEENRFAKEVVVTINPNIRNIQLSRDNEKVEEFQETAI